MKQESYKTLAEHFAEKAGLRLIFEPGACPSTNGDYIVLPTEVNDDFVNALLGAVLHETAHIKWTEPAKRVLRNRSELLRVCINALEDIRVDTLTSKRYPNSLDFIRELSNHVIENKRDGLRAEPLPIQVIKALCFASEGFDPAAIYDADTLALFERCRGFIDAARRGANTLDIVKLARRLLIQLIGKDNKPKPRRPEGGGAGEPGEGEQSEEGEGAPGGTLEEYADAADAAEKDARRLDEERNKKREDYNEQGKKLQQKYNQVKRQQQAASRLERDKNVAEQQGNQETTDKARERLEQKQKVVKLMSEDYNKDFADYQREQKKLRDLEQQYESAQRAADNADINIDTTLDLMGADYGEGLSIGGFDAIDPGELKPEDGIIQLDKKTIDEIIAEALIEKKDELVLDEQGARLNSGALADFETAPEKLFNQREQRHDLTKIAFILDVSGSMGDFSSGSLRTAFEALDVLLRATKDAIDQGAPADVSVYGFGSDCIKIFGSIADYDTQKAQEQINDMRMRIGSSTEILLAVNKVSEDLLSEADNRALVLITDAAVSQEDVTAIINKSSGDCKQVYIAIDGNLHGETEKLFGDNNIIGGKDALDVIGRALYRAI